MFGPILRWIINTWIGTTGKVRSYKTFPWLYGPISEKPEIGADFYNVFASRENLSVVTSPDAGLIEDFTALIADDDPNKARLHPRVRHFYEHTKQYKLEVWSQWYRPMSLFARILIGSLSRDMDQLNIPLKPMETSRGMSNDVLQLRDGDGMLRYACWLRKSMLSGKVVYAGFYSGIEAEGRKYVRVIFPLPDGNITVVLSVHVQDDGSVKLLSGGRSEDIAGYYRVRKRDKDSVKLKKIPLRESIHVYEDGEGVLRTDHKFWFLGVRMLHLHYRING